MRWLLSSLILLLALLPATQAQVPTRDTPMDKAIDRALQFLANTQDRSDGSWKVRGVKNAAITSLCVMAFLSAGNVPGEGKYGDVLEKAVRAVLRRSNPTA